MELESCAWFIRKSLWVWFPGCLVLWLLLFFSGENVWGFEAGGNSGTAPTDTAIRGTAEDGNVSSNGLC